MTFQDDETLQMYLEESLEHLADIENDFLAIEKAGANIDEDLVNKVYRAAHSIKGGAGFMGLTTIKNLTHEMENILGKIRGRELIPTTEIVNTLLEASDTLTALVKDVHNSNNVDISYNINKLKALSKGKHTTSNQTSSNDDNQSKSQNSSAIFEDSDQNSDASTDQLEIKLPGKSPFFVMDRNVITEMMHDGKNVYLVNINIKSDIIKRGKSLQALVEEMDQTGVLLNSNMDLTILEDRVEMQAESSGKHLIMLFASILKPTDINVLFEINEDNIYILSSNYKLQPIKTTMETSADAPDSNESSSDRYPDNQTSQTPPAEMIEESSDSISVAPQVSSISKDKNSETTSTKKANSVNTNEHETSLRVNVSLLDQLMTLAGELVLSRNQLLQSMASDDKRSSETAGQRIDLITSELQEAIMLTRMQSIGNVFNKFPRVVRDLARSLGKKVELILEGKDVELDKTIIEAIGDPLTHLVRNAVDHGIELPKTRIKDGKNEVGQIFLKAYHEAGQVNIEIADDGKGLNGGKLTEKALEKGLITEEQAKLMSEKERINLIFLPGFSTAEKITDVSGRGVGMDVVKTNLDKLGGLIDIDSKLGKGSTIRIKLPLTLAIIPSQIIMTGNERYAIPQVNLEELLRIPADQVKKRIERVGNAEVVRLRGNLLPLIKLSHVIGVDSVYTDPKTGLKCKDRRESISDRRGKKTNLFDADVRDVEIETDSENNSIAEKRKFSSDRRYHASSALNIVVVSTGAMKYGLVVDELHDSEEIVVKPLGRDLKQCKGYAGATIMGDGRVALILDVSNLAQMSGLVSLEGSKRATEVALEAQEEYLIKKDQQAFLIFRSSEKEQFAAPLSLVERIEKIKASDIEYLGGKRVIKYRGGTLPLFSIEEVATVEPLADKNNLLVIVFTVARREIGLLAIGPVDAVETTLDVDGSTLKQTGIMGSAIINGQTTQLVDVYEIVKALNPQWFDQEKKHENDETNRMTILFAEDSRFFRNQVKGSMEDQGYQVIEAEDGVEAWQLLQDHFDEIGIVVTDIEMPNLNGFELTQKIKSNPNFSHLPIIALTTLAGDEDVQKGKKVGINDYQIKLDREKLLESIHNFLNRK
jgi:two-component system, chemotaxis family, sensor kinase CheA